MERSPFWHATTTGVAGGTAARTSAKNAALGFMCFAPSQKPPVPYATACFSAPLKEPSLSSTNSGTFTLPFTCTCERRHADKRKGVKKTLMRSPYAA